MGLELPGNAPAQREGSQSAVKDDILRHCRAALPRYKVPAAISFVPALKVGGATGKLLRRHG